MTIFQAIILGVIQGLTEFLPISSSGHLILVSIFLGWEVQSLAFDAALHLGTLGALLLYFSAQLKNQLRNPLFLQVILIGTLPAVGLGLLLNDYLDTVLRSPVVVGVNLILIALVMWFVQKRAQSNRDQTKLTKIDGLVIGLYQALALVPGVSRSGSTIIGGLQRGLTLPEAASFAFLLGLPVIAGAALFKVIALYLSAGLSKTDFGLMAVGIASAAVVGLLTIRLLLKYLGSHSLKIFIVYRIILGIIVLWLFS